MSMSKSQTLWLALLPALWLAGCATTSSQWQQVGITEQGTIAYSVDKNSIQKQGNIAKFKAQTKYLKVNVAPQNFPAHETTITTWEMNCLSGVYRPLQTELLDKNGKVIHSSTITADFQPAPSRETAMYRQRQLVCKGK